MPKSKNKIALKKAKTEQIPETPEKKPRPKEFGGPKGKEPTRYGDWERNGRCIDF